MWCKMVINKIWNNSLQDRHIPEKKYRNLSETFAIGISFWTEAIEIKKINRFLQIKNL